MLRKGLTDTGRQRLRDSAMLHKPWRFATGPRSEVGRAQSRKNGKRRQTGELSVRQVQAMTADAMSLVKSMAKLRRTMQLPSANIGDASCD